MKLNQSEKPVGVLSALSVLNLFWIILLELQILVFQHSGWQVHRSLKLFMFTLQKGSMKRYTDDLHLA